MKGPKKLACRTVGEWQIRSSRDYSSNYRSPFADVLVEADFTSPSGTRRSAWRGTFCGLGIIGGFENSWAPWMVLDKDLPGVADMTIVHRFFTDVLPFSELRPVENAVRGTFAPGTGPLVLASKGNAILAVYFPTGGSAEIDVGKAAVGKAEWFDTRSGARKAAKVTVDKGVLHATAPEGKDEDGHPLDWILIARK